MVKLQAELLRYLGKDEFRVLTAVEMGMRNHELVPISIISSIAGLRGGAERVITFLHRHKLVWHGSAPYHGYRLTCVGYDYLALHTLVKRGTIASLGPIIGMGKESDIFLVMNEQQEELVLKLHRLGRTSFRNVKEKRDYLKHRSSAGNWLYLSRLSALKEFAFMTALHSNNFSVPTPVDHNRHAVLMSRAPGYLLSQCQNSTNPGRLYKQVISMMIRLVYCGLVHCDYNEFNLIVSENGTTVTLIDFPQMVPVTHPNAAEYFNHDVATLRSFFARRFNYTSDYNPVFAEVMARRAQDGAAEPRLAAEGLSAPDAAALEEELVGTRGGGGGGGAAAACSDDSDSDSDSSDDDSSCEDEDDDENAGGSSDGEAGLTPLNNRDVRVHGSQRAAEPEPESDPDPVVAQLAADLSNVLPDTATAADAAGPSCASPAASSDLRGATTAEAAVPTAQHIAHEVRRSAARRHHGGGRRNKRQGKGKKSDTSSGAFF